MSATNYVDAVRDIAAGKKPTKVYAGMPKEERDRLKEEKKAEKLAVKEAVKAQNWLRLKTKSLPKLRNWLPKRLLRLRN